MPVAQARRLVRQTLHAWQRTREPAVRQELWERLLADVAAASHPQRKKPRPAEPRRKRLVPETFPPLRGSRLDARRALNDSLLKS